MKHGIKQQLIKLEMELKNNEKIIKDLSVRNDKIRAVFKTLENAVGIVPKAVVRKEAITPGTLREKVMNLLPPGIPLKVAAIARRLNPDKPIDQVAINSVSNVCSGLVNTGHITRVSRGVYQSNVPKPETAAEIGHDTRVKQVSAGE